MTSYVIEKAGGSCKKTAI